METDRQREMMRGRERQKERHRARERETAENTLERIPSIVLSENKEVPC